jgi:hypothetical protein
VPGRAKARGPPYVPIPGPLNGPCRPGPVTDRAGPCLDRAKFVPCHGPNGRPALFGHLYMIVLNETIKLIFLHMFIFIISVELLKNI